MIKRLPNYFELFGYVHAAYCRGCGGRIAAAETDQVSKTRSTSMSGTAPLLEIPIQAKKAMVARRLPRVLIVYNVSNDAGICWKDTDAPVTDREWLAVMAEAEKLLTFEQRYPYMRLLGFREASAWDGGFNGLDAPWEARLDAFITVVKPPAAVNTCDPQACPYCRGRVIRFVNGHGFTTTTREGVTDLDEWQCHGECGGRSFFT